MENIDNINVEKSTIDDKWHMLDNNIKLLATEYYNRALALGHIMKYCDKYYSPEPTFLKIYESYIEARNNYETATVSKDLSNIKPNVTTISELPHKVKKLVVKTFARNATIKQKIELNQKLYEKLQELAKNVEK